MASFFFLDQHPSRAGRKAASADMAAAAVEAPTPEWAPSSSFRKEVKPPALFSRAQPQWRQWATKAWHWLWDDEDLADHPRVLQGLSQVKTEFLSVVWDLQSYTATRARESITQARSLRELWHLRADVFRVIAVHRGQAEAYRRLESLNRHFPVRVTSSNEAPSAASVSHW